MVATPWGDSEKLQDRRLTRGRGPTRKEVRDNQRARIYAAMVASICEVGYEGSGVDEIAAISGVSSRTVYDLFPGGKEECFGAVLGEILEASLGAISVAGAAEEGWERRLAAIYGCVARMVATQPAAAGLVLTDAYAAGPDAAKQLRRSTRALERVFHEHLSRSPERAGMPEAMVTAQVGALQELARARIGRGEAEGLPDLVPQLVDLIAGYRPPPERLRLGNRRPALETDDISSSEEAERIIRGFTLALADHGYARVRVNDIIGHASMSPNTFYTNFADKRAVLMAAVDSATAQMAALAMAAYRRSPGWATGVRAAIGSALGFLAARPATANLLLAEIHAGGHEALAVRAARLGEVLGILEERARESPEVPPVAPEAILGGILALTHRRLLSKGAEGLPSLAPIATYIALAPYLGAEEACRVANGDGRPGPRGANRDEPNSPPRRRTKWVVQAMLGSRWATAEDLAEALGAPAEEIVGYLEELEGDGLVEQITPIDGDGVPEWIAVRQMRVVNGEDWAALTDDERRTLASAVVRLMVSDIGEGLRSGAFGLRLDEHHTRLLVALDQEGWAEMAEVHRVAFEASQAIRVRSERRLRESGEKPIVGRSLQVLFELPEE